MDTLTWHSAQARFLEYLRRERNLSVETLRAYSSDLRQFASYLSSIHGESGMELDAISPDIIRGYLASIHKKLEKTSRARKLSTLRSFFRYLNSAGLYAENPSELVAHPKITQKMPSFLPVDEVFHFPMPLRTRHCVKGFHGERPETGHFSNHFIRQVSV